VPATELRENARKKAMVQDARYFPLPDGVPWEVVPPGAVGFDPTKLEPVVAAVSRSETSWPIEIRPYLEAGFFEPPPFNELLGPTEPRGRPNGLLSRGGRIVARWGDTRRVDMTFSVAKSYLSLIAGLAVMDGLIRDLDEPVGSTVKDGGFDGDHDGQITWQHFLQQTSEWEGTLWGKPDQIDRNRVVPSRRYRDVRETLDPCASRGPSGNTMTSVSTG